ncbi:uncharacterized protein LOC126585669 isoform X2 [Malus sylvestris]|nr:uncharacterized protein LOC126585669 isoform X2 [Malus sylvestris]XP_050106093.1 uncharacterized protein LOC126585669 isoform X2 [Malus sylvestris]XP_050106094.1 uncharacterized protein LOC126585669 isoform X2 [Malus sylvestris]
MKRFGWKMRRRSLYPWKHAFRKAHIHLCLANRAWRARPQMVYAYTSMNKVVNPAGWRNNNHPERDNNVAYGEYKCMGPGSSTYHKRNLSKELTDEQVKPFISSGYIQEKFPDQITEKSQLQRFLGSLNYVSEFYPHMRQQCKPLFDRLKENPPAWSTIHTSIVKQIKNHVKTLPCLGIPTPNSFKIVETDASDVGYGGILKQQTSSRSPE